MCCSSSLPAGQPRQCRRSPGEGSFSAATIPPDTGGQGRRRVWRPMSRLAPRRRSRSAPGPRPSSPRPRWVGPQAASCRVALPSSAVLGAMAAWLALLPGPCLVGLHRGGRVGKSRSSPIFSASPKDRSLASRSCLTRASAKTAPCREISSRTASRASSAVKSTSTFASTLSTNQRSGPGPRPAAPSARRRNGRLCLHRIHHDPEGNARPRFDQPGWLAIVDRQGDAIRHLPGQQGDDRGSCRVVPSELVADTDDDRPDDHLLRCILPDGNPDSAGPPRRDARWTSLPRLSPVSMPRRVLGRVFGSDAAGLMAHATSQFPAPFPGPVLLTRLERVFLGDQEALGRSDHLETVLL